MPDIINYEVACMQTRARQVSLDDEEQRDLDIRANIERIVRADRLRHVVRQFRGQADRDAGVRDQRPLGRAWTSINGSRSAPRCPGPYTDLLAEKAKQRKVYLAVNLLEVHPRLSAALLQLLDALRSGRQDPDQALEEQQQLLGVPVHDAGRHLHRVRREVRPRERCSRWPRPRSAISA